MFDKKFEHVKETGFSGRGADVVRTTWCVVRGAYWGSRMLSGGLCYLVGGHRWFVQKRRGASAFALRAMADKSLPAAVQGDFGFFHIRGDREAQMGANFTASAFFRLLPASSGFFRLLPGTTPRKFFDRETLKP
jgi:hypothetical protein